MMIVIILKNCYEIVNFIIYIIIFIFKHFINLKNKKYNTILFQFFVLFFILVALIYIF